ncbi:MAG: sugar phosphate isomerase/epimerase family protein [Chloroflexota bacterium]|jgi:sugar phosphate isomerase/epimerase
MLHKYAAQLYTVRDALEKDYNGVLKALREQGWQAVQVSGTRGYTPEQIAGFLREHQLKTAGMHISIAELTNDMADVMRQATLYGTRDIIVPYLAREYQNELGYQMFKSHMNALAKPLNAAGFRLSYHNHDFEFATTINGVSALAYLLEPSADNAILAEIDVYWVKKGGADPLAFIAPYSHRMPIIHLKDMAADGSFGAIGTGSIDFVPILRWGEANGIEWYAVEQDICPGDPLDALNTSLTNLRAMTPQV